MVRAHTKHRPGSHGDCARDLATGCRTVAARACCGHPNAPGGRGRAAEALSGGSRPAGNLVLVLNSTPNFWQRRSARAGILRQPDAPAAHCRGRFWWSRPPIADRARPVPEPAGGRRKAHSAPTGGGPLSSCRPVLGESRPRARHAIDRSPGPDRASQRSLLESNAAGSHAYLLGDDVAIMLPTAAA
jgi:hypothetical protein